MDMKGKKVLFVTENLGSGGAERQLTGLAVLLRQAGNIPVVVTWLDRNFYKGFLSENGVEHIQLCPKNRFDRVLKLAALFRRLKPDLVVSYLPMANETAALASILSPVKLVVSERSFTTEWGLRRKLTNLLYRRASYVVANSENEAENIRVHCSELAGRTLAIPNFIDVDSFRQKKDIAEMHQPFRFVGVGRVIESKNLMRLVDAFSALKKRGMECRIDWYGAFCDPTYASVLKKHIIEAQLEKSFLLCGESHNIADVYNHADAFILPSLLEGYPNVLVEAMATGLPVAVSAVCEHPHIVSEGVNGFLFQPHDTVSMISAMQRILQLTLAERKSMSEANVRLVRERNSPAVFCQRYLDLV